MGEFAKSAQDLNVQDVSINPAGRQGFTLDERASEPATATDGKWQMEYVTSTINIGDIAAQTGSTAAASIPGLRVGDLCFFVGTVGDIANASTFHFWTEVECETEGSIEFHFFNADNASSNPDSGDYGFLVIHRFINT